MLSFSFVGTPRCFNTSHQAPPRSAASHPLCCLSVSVPPLTSPHRTESLRPRVRAPLYAPPHLSILSSSSHVHSLLHAHLECIAPPTRAHPALLPSGCGARAHAESPLHSGTGLCIDCIAVDMLAPVEPMLVPKRDEPAVRGGASPSQPTVDPILEHDEPAVRGGPPGVTGVRGGGGGGGTGGPISITRSKLAAWGAGVRGGEPLPLPTQGEVPRDATRE